jgi:hypothetical protein
LSEIVTETTKIYPRGRGKVLVISEKSVIKKPKKGKSPCLTLFSAKSNPESIRLKLFVGKNGVKRYVIFPEGRVLQYEERLELASALVASLKRKVTSLSTYCSHRRLKVINNGHKKIKGLFTQDLRNISQDKIKQIDKFVRRIENES